MPVHIAQSIGIYLGSLSFEICRILCRIVQSFPHLHFVMHRSDSVLCYNEWQMINEMMEFRKERFGLWLIE